MTAPAPSPNAPSGFNPWPYGIAGFLILFATSVVLFARFALGHPVDLVRPDYYEQEIRHQQQMDRVARTRALGDRVGIQLEDGASTLVVRLPVEQVRGDTTGSIQLYRPSRTDRDRVVPLQPDAAGRQVVDLEGLLPGLWKVRMQWTAGTEDYFLEAPVVVPRRAP